MSGTAPAAGTSTYAQRQLSATFTLAPIKDNNGKIVSQPTFTESGTNQVTVSGFRASAHVVKAGGQAMGELQLRINGLTLSLMNQLSTMTVPLPTVLGNQVSLSAGDTQSGMAVVFEGTMSEVWPDMAGAPDVALMVQANAGLGEAVTPVPPVSFNGGTDVGTIMQGLAKTMGLTFENNGVSVQLSNPYLSGTARTQAYECADAAGINVTIDNGKLAIWPRGGNRAGSVPLISPTTGMVGYPTLFGQGRLGITTLFNPAIIFGGQVQVQSSLTRACGTWNVYNLVHDLTCQTPNGSWFTTMVGNDPKYVVVQ